MKDQGAGRARTATNGETVATVDGEVAGTGILMAIAITDSIDVHKSVTAGSG
jgi:hypothetical protein